MNRCFLLPPAALYAMALFFLLACGENQEEAGIRAKIPENILGETAFAKVLTDFALAESAVNLNIKNVAAARMDTVYAFNPLKENHISQAKYDSTILFYTRHTELYKKVYENVLAALSEIQTRRDSLAKVKTSKQADSVSKVQTSKHLDSLKKASVPKRPDHPKKARIAKRIRPLKKVQPSK